MVKSILDSNCRNDCWVAALSGRGDMESSSRKKNRARCYRTMFIRRNNFIFLWIEAKKLAARMATHANVNDFTLCAAVVF